MNLDQDHVAIKQSIQRIDEISASVEQIEEQMGAIAQRIMKTAVKGLVREVGYIERKSPDGPILIEREILDSGFDYLGISPHTFIVQFKPEDIIDRPKESAKLLAAFGREEARRFKSTWTSGEMNDDDWYSVEEGVASWLESIFQVKGCIGNITLLIMDKRVVGGAGAIASANPHSVVDDITTSIKKYVGLSDYAPEDVNSHYKLQLADINNSLREVATSNVYNMIGYSQLFVSSDRLIPILESADNVERLWQSIADNEVIKQGKVGNAVWGVFTDMVTSIKGMNDISLGDKSRYIYRLLSVAIALLPMADLTERVNQGRQTLDLPSIPTLVACWTQTEIPHNKMSAILDQFGQIQQIFDSSNILSKLYLIGQTRRLRPIPGRQLNDLLSLGRSYKQVARTKLVKDGDEQFLRADTSGKSEVVAAVFGFEQIVKVLSDIRLTTALLSGNPKFLKLLNRNQSES